MKNALLAVGNLPRMLLIWGHLGGACGGVRVSPGGGVLSEHRVGAGGITAALSYVTALLLRPIFRKLDETRKKKQDRHTPVLFFLAIAVVSGGQSTISTDALTPVRWA